MPPVHNRQRRHRHCRATQIIIRVHILLCDIKRRGVSRGSLLGYVNIWASSSLVHFVIVSLVPYSKASRFRHQKHCLYMPHRSWTCDSIRHSAGPRRPRPMSERRSTYWRPDIVASTCVVTRSNWARSFHGTCANFRRRSTHSRRPARARPSPPTVLAFNFDPV